MVSLVILIGLVLLPLVAALLFRSNGAVAFLSVCLGSVLAAAVSTDVADFITGFTPLDSEAVVQWVQAGLVILPLLVSVLMTRRSVPASKQLLNFIPALAAGLLLVLFVVPVLPDSVKDLATSNTLWDSILNLETLVLLAGGLAAYTLFLFLRPHRKDDEKKH